MTSHGVRVTWAVALGLALLVGIFPQFALGALGPQLRVDLQLDPEDLGLIFAGLYAVGVVGSPIAGRIVDRIGGRRSCVGLLLVSGGALALGSLAESRTGLILAMLPAGASMAFANPGTNRWASAAPTPRAQATLVGIAQAGVQAGALGAGVLAAAHAFGLDWREALRIGSFLAAVGAFAAWRAPEDRTSATVSSAQGGGNVRSPKPDDQHGQDRRTQRSLAAYALMMGGGTAVVFAYLPSYAVDVAQLSISAAGATAMVFGGTALLCRLGLGAVLRRPDQMGPRLLVAMSLGSALAIIVIAAGALAPVWIWLGAIVFGATGTTWPAVAFLAVVRASPPGSAGRVTGWVTAAFYMGLWISPPIAGWLIVRAGYAPVWAGAVGCYLLALVPMLLSRRAGRGESFNLAR